MGWIKELKIKGWQKKSLQNNKALMSLHTVKHNFKTTKLQREQLHGHKSYLLWFTGLSGSGKSTLANLVEIELHKKGLSTYILDGDNVRQGINKD